MTPVDNWFGLLYGSFQDLLPTVLGYLGDLIQALLVFIIGLIVATGLRSLVERAVAASKLDSFLHKLGITEYVHRAGLQLNSARFLGALVYWFVFVWFLSAILQALRLNALSEFLDRALNYVPMVIVAALMMLATVLVAKFLKALVTASIMGAKMHSAKFVGSLTWWAVVIFGFSAALQQLGIDPYTINALITGFIAMVVLAAGIAFGLGGKEYAGEILKKVRDQI